MAARGGSGLADDDPLDALDRYGTWKRADALLDRASTEAGIGQPDDPRASITL